MKRIFNFLKYCQLLTFILLLGATNSTVFFSDTRWDFGTVHQQEKITKKIEITNHGAGVLEISITGTCDCLNANPAWLLLKPGEKKPVILSYNPADDSGKVRKYFFISTNNPAIDRAIFPIQGSVIAKSNPNTAKKPTTPPKHRLSHNYSKPQKFNYSIISG